MTIVFRMSSFYFVVVIAFNAHVLMIDSDHGSMSRMNKSVSRLFNEDGRYREDLHEQRSQVEFASIADHVMNKRLARWFDFLSRITSVSRIVENSVTGLSGICFSVFSTLLPVFDMHHGKSIAARKGYNRHGKEVFSFTPTPLSA